MRRELFALVFILGCSELASAQPIIENEPSERAQDSVPSTESTTAKPPQPIGQAIPKCEKSLGTIAVIEPDQNWWKEHDLGSPDRILKEFVQRSGCFTLVDPGRSLMENYPERNLGVDKSAQPERRGSADFYIQPDVLRSQSFSGLGSAIGGILGAPAYAGAAIKKDRAGVTLSLVNTRTTVEEAITDGFARASSGQPELESSSLAKQAYGDVGGGYSDTEMGRIILKAYADAFDKLVIQMGGYTKDNNPAPVPGGDAPFLPWPPPHPSSIKDITSKFRSSETVGGYETQIRRRLERRGYESLHFFSVPYGFGLTTDVERIETDGRPADNRWATDKVPMIGSLMQYVSALFTGDSGRFRVFAFIVSSEPPVPASYKPTQMDLNRWKNTGKPFLTEQTRRMAATPQTKVWLLVYEFESSNNKSGELVAASDGGMSFRKHAAFLGLE